MLITTNFNSEYPKNNQLIVEINSNATAQGSFLLNVDNLLEVLSSSATVFLCTPPTVLNSKFLKTGSDLFTTDILDVEFKKDSVGNITVYWTFDAGEISASENQFYGINISVNTAENASVGQASIEFFIKITDQIIAGA